MKAIFAAAAVAISLGAAVNTATAQGLGPVYTAPMMTGHPMYGQGPFWAPGMSFDRHMGTMIIDQDTNGMVSADEAAAWHEANFSRMDENGDGKVEKAEFLGAGMGRGTQHFNRREARFIAIDDNSDGSITLAEYMADTEQRFAAADTDGDGKVSVWEYRGRHRM